MALDDQGIEVIANPVAYVLIRTAAGGGGDTLTTISIESGEDLTLYCAAYDSFNVYLGDTSATWSTQGALPSGGMSPSPSGRHMTYSHSGYGVTGQIKAIHNDGVTDFEHTTGDITILRPAEVVYKANSLSETQIAYNQAYTFSSELINPGGYDLTLSTSTTLYITDGTKTYSAQLSAQTDLPAGDTTLVSFNEETVPLLASGFYTATLDIEGSDERGKPYTVDGLALDDQGIEVLHIEISSVISPLDEAAPGQENIPLIITIINWSSIDYQINGVDVHFGGNESFVSLQDTNTDKTVAANSVRAYELLIAIDASISGGQIAASSVNVEGQYGATSHPIVDISSYELLNIIPVFALQYRQDEENPPTITLTQTKDISLRLYKQPSMPAATIASNQMALVFTDGVSEILNHASSAVEFTSADTSRLVIFEDTALPDTFDISSSEIQVRYIGRDISNVEFEDTLFVENFLISPETEISFLDPSFSPRSITLGQSLSVTLEIINSAGTGCTLLADSSYLYIENGMISDSLFLSNAGETIDANGLANELEFGEIQFTESGQLGEWAVGVSLLSIDENFHKTRHEASLNETWIEVSSPPMINLSSALLNRKVLADIPTEIIFDISNEGGTGLNLDSLGALKFYSSDTLRLEIPTRQASSALLDTSGTVTITSESFSFDPEFADGTAMEMFWSAAGNDINQYRYWSDTLSLGSITGFLGPNIIALEGGITPSVVMASQDSISLTVAVQNVGDSPLLCSELTRLELRDESNLIILDPALDIALNNLEIQNGSDTTLIPFSAENQNGLVPGDYLATLKFRGSTREAIPWEDNVLNNTDTIRIREPGKLTVLNQGITPKRVTASQQIVEFKIRATNAGQTNLYLFLDQTKLTLPQLTADTLNPTLISDDIIAGEPIEPGDDFTLQFSPVNIPDTLTGQVQGMITLLGSYGEDIVYKDTVDQEYTLLTVFPPSEFAVDSSQISPEVIYRLTPTSLTIPFENLVGMGSTLDTSTYVRYSIGNLSHRSALVEPLEVDGFGLEYGEFEPIIFASDFGDIHTANIDVIALGKDSNQVAFFDTISFSPDPSTMLLTRPDMAVLSIPANAPDLDSTANPYLVAQGDRGKLIQFDVTNFGGSSAYVDSVLLSFYADGNADKDLAYNWRLYRDSNIYLEVGDTTRISVFVDVGSAEVASNTEIRASVLWKDSFDLISGLSEENEIHSWEVTRKPTLAIEDIYSSQDTLTADYGSDLTIYLPLENNSTASVIVERGMIRLHDNYGMLGDYFAQDLPLTIPSYQSDTLALTVNAYSRPIIPGSVIVQGFAYGTETRLHKSVSDSTQLSTGRVLYLHAESPPELAFSKLRAARNSFNANEIYDGLEEVVSMAIHNHGEAAAVLTTVDTPQVFISAPSAQDLRLGAGDLTLPRILEGGDSVIVQYPVIETGQLLGKLQSEMAVGYYDINDVNQDQVDTLVSFSRLNPDNVFIESRADLSVAEIFVPDKSELILRYNKLETLSVILENQGDEFIDSCEFLIEHSDTLLFHGVTHRSYHWQQFDTLNVNLIGMDLGHSNITLKILEVWGSNITRSQTSGSSWQESYSIESVPTDPPQINNCFYIDGGYDYVPDGEVNERDLIQVVFNQAIRQPTEFPQVDANDIFFLNGGGDFGLGSSVITPEMAATPLDEANRDSSLFVLLGANPKLYLDNLSESLTKSGGAYSQSSDGLAKTSTSGIQIAMRIKPGIPLGVINGLSNNDAGQVHYYEILEEFIQSMVNMPPELSYEGSGIIQIADPFPPTMYNFAPVSNQNQPASPYSSIHFFLTGRNLIEKESLRSLLQDLTFDTDTVAVDSLLNDSDRLITFLKSIYDDRQDDVLDFRSALSSYTSPPVVNLNTLVTNPLYQFYEPVEVLPDFELYSEEVSESYLIDLLEVKTADFTNETGLWNPQAKDIQSVVLEPMDELPENTEIFFKVVTGMDTTVIRKRIFAKTAAGDRSSGGFAIYSAPNPARSGDHVEVEYEIPPGNESGSFELVLIDAAGIPVRKWVNELVTSPGRHRLLGGWDLTNGNEQAVSHGVYLFILRNESVVVASWVAVVG